MIECSKESVNHDCEYIEHKVVEYGVVWSCSLLKQGKNCICSNQKEEEIK